MIQALKEAGREDLIGFGPGCLVRPDYAPAKPKKPKTDGEAKPSGAGRGKGKKSEAAPPESKKPVSRKGWAKAKPKKNSKPGKGKRK